MPEVKQDRIQVAASGVIWDFDGTLFDSFKLLVEVLSETLRRRGMNVPHHDVFVNNYHGHLLDSIQEISGLEGDQLQAVYDEFIQSEEHHYEQPEALFHKDALELLRRSHATGLKQIIISNRSHYSNSRLGSPRNLAQREPLVGLIDAVVCADDNEFHKPDARMLDKAERDFNLERSTLVVVGDQFVDAELAYNVGARAILIARTPNGIPHLDRLPEEWQKRIMIIKSLDQVSITPQDKQ